MRRSVIAAMTAAAMRMRRRSEPPGFTEISGAIVTAALFANLGGGVNAGVRDDSGGCGAPLRSLTFGNLAAHVIPPAVHLGNLALRWLFSLVNSNNRILAATASTRISEQ